MSADPSICFRVNSNSTRIVILGLPEHLSRPCSSQIKAVLCYQIPLHMYNSMSYVYQQLQNPETDIRVAVLHPGSFEDEIRISFRTRRLKKVLVQPVRTGRPSLNKSS
jgi:hypothetical protein